MEKVRFLSRAENYPEAPERVEAKETHMSWVFLTTTQAFKLKKPVRTKFLDYSTLEARRYTVEEEVRLNRRLAPGVYQGVVPLTVDPNGQLQFDGRGEVVDWLVKMSRLRSERMLDHAIATRSVTAEDTRRIGEVLASFYRSASAVEMSFADYRAALEAEVQANRSELSARADDRLLVERVDQIAVAQLGFLVSQREMFDGRVAAGRVVEGHGDLRPEHISVETPPVVIDCLEFSKSLRTLDAASELTFLWLECERLGAPEIGRTIFDTYCRASGDSPPPALIRFYKSWHACVRAKVAVWHLNDHGLNHPEKWISKAADYLRLAWSNLPFDARP
ncbi:MAG TPA: hypothetical protein VL069_08560 [Opitutus sp.]|nr:hypothetical protein [Opitutus sp.]